MRNQFEEMASYVDEDFPGGFHATVPDTESYYMEKCNEMLQQLNDTLDELEQRNRELDMIISAMPGGMFIVDDKFPYRYRLISTEAAALFGYSSKEIKKITGGYAANLVHAEDRGRVYQAIAASLAARSTYIVKYRVFCKDGSLRHIVERGKRVINEKGNPSLVSMYLDATHAAIPGFPSSSYLSSNDHLDMESKIKTHTEIL